MKFRPFASSGTPDAEHNGYDVPSYQPLGIDGYLPETVIATWQQVGFYRLPLASVANQNNGGMLRNDGVNDLSSSPNVYMPIWGAPSNGKSVNQVGGRVQVPMSSYVAGQVTANAFVANADQTSLVAQFIQSKSPRYSGLSSNAGE